MEGMDVVDEMASVKRDAQDRPLYDITIDAIEINE